VTQEDRAHMEILDKLRSTFVGTVARVSSTSSRCENGPYDGTERECEFLF
jgi:hypothetical protein